MATTASTSPARSSDSAWSSGAGASSCAPGACSASNASSGSRSGLATLRLATPSVYAQIDEAASTIKTAATEALTAAGVPHVVQSAGSMFSVFFCQGPVRDFADASRTDARAYAAFFHAMLDRGVYLPPSAYEAWFLSAAHDERAIQAVLDALPSAAAAAAKESA